jgi:hypothetical protein
MLRMLEAQAPAKQTTANTIAILSSRLNASLIEDRRAAVLGLRSFANEYPASVASDSLHGLLRCLSTDLEDVDTIELVLDTLLKLLNHSPNGVSSTQICTPILTLRSQKPARIYLYWWQTRLLKYDSLLSLSQLKLSRFRTM